MPTTKMTVRTKDGEVFSGTPVSILRQMHATSWAPCPDDAAFMAEMAKRALELTGQFVRDSSPKVFIDDLLACGLLELITPLAKPLRKDES